MAALPAVAGLTFGLASAADPAGDLVIGKCDRNGWAYGYGTVEEAREAAVAHRASEGDASCHVVYAIDGNCAAFAVDGSCGARG